MDTTLDTPSAHLSAALEQASSFEAALNCLSEADEILMYEAYERAAVDAYPLARAADELTAGDTVQVQDDGAWVALRVWVPRAAIALN